MGVPNSKPITDLNTAEIEAQVVALKRQDLTFRQIADRLGVATMTAHRAFQRAKQRVIEATDFDTRTYINGQLAGIEASREILREILAAHHVVISNGHVVSEIIGRDADGTPQYGDPYTDDAPVMAAIDRLVKLDAQEAQLLGLNAEQKTSLTANVRYELVGIDPADLT